MEEIRIRLPDELKELALIRGINWQFLLSKKLNEALEEVASVKRVISKSKLSQEDADKLSDEVNISLAEKYSSLLKE